MITLIVLLASVVSLQLHMHFFYCNKYIHVCVLKYLSFLKETIWKNIIRINFWIRIYFYYFCRSYDLLHLTLYLLEIVRYWNLITVIKQSYN